MSNRQIYVNSMKSAFVTLGKKTVMTALSSVPLFVIPPFSTLAGMAVEWVLVKAAEGGDTLVFFQFVDLRAAAQNKEFTAAALENYQAQQTGTTEEKKRAEEKLIKAHDTFIKLNRI